MAIPGFQTLMLPLLDLAGDAEVHTISEAIETLAWQFRLTEEDKRELLPSGTMPRLNNRVGWARTHLVKAGLLESAGRGKFRITERGLEVLRRRPDTIDLRFLKQFPEFVEFRNTVRQISEEESDEEATQTPEELLESSYQNLRGKLAQELLSHVMECSPAFFEKLVVDLLVKMGYGGSRKDAGQAVGQSGDGGIDGIIKEDKLGLDAVYIQAKRWENPVGRPVVQAFAGSLMGSSARKGVLITTSRFTKDAVDYANSIQQPKIILVDGEQLADLMIDHSIGVVEKAAYSVKRIDIDYFGEE